MAVVPFAPLAATTMRERCDGSDRDALVGRLLDLCNRSHPPVRRRGSAPEPLDVARRYVLPR